MNLQQLQQAIQDAIVNEDDLAQPYIDAGEQLTEKQRISIYRNGYYARLFDILKSDYEALYGIMGEDAFSSMVHDYLNAYPSKNYNIRMVGQYLPTFLAEQEGCHLLIIELTQFEWAMIESLYAADAPLLTMNHLSNMEPNDWDKWVLHFHPSVRLLQCQYNTLDIWQAAKKNEVIPEFIKQEVPILHLIWRFNNEVFYTAALPEQAALFTAIAKGKDFLALSADMLEYFDHDEVVAWIVESLRYWTTQQLFVSIFNLF